MTRVVRLLEPMFDRIGTAPNRVVEHSPGPNPAIDLTDWRAAMQSNETCCAHCNGPLTTKQRKRGTKHCSRSCGRPTESERFWSKVAKRQPYECWEWQGPLNNKGYGRFATYSKTDTTRHLAHRYALADLGLLDPRLVVMHVCDNPPCCNPLHLRQGTQRDNIRDALRKGRLDLSGLEIGQRLTEVEKRAIQAGVGVHARREAA